MITPTQMRAARAMLNLSQGEVAKSIGIAANTLSNIESGASDAPSSRLKEIQDFYERSGVLFTEAEGVKLNRQEIVRYESQKGFVAFMTDVMETAKAGGKDICIANVNENDWEQNLPADFAEQYRSEMQQVKGLKSKIIVKESDDFHTAKGFAEYRSVPASVFSDDACFYAYGDKLALITFLDGDVQIVVLKNKKFSDSYRTLFHAIWNNNEVIK